MCALDSETDRRQTDLGNAQQRVRREKTLPVEMHRGADVPSSGPPTVPPSACAYGSRPIGRACARMEVNEVVGYMRLLYSRSGAGLLDERNLQLSRVPAPTQV